MDLIYWLSGSVKAEVFTVCVKTMQQSFQEWISSSDCAVLRETAKSSKPSDSADFG